MKRYKFLISLFFLFLMVVFLFSFSVFAAEEYMYSLKELIDAGQLYSDIVYHDNSNSYDQTVTSNTTHWSEAVRLYLPDLSSSGSVTTQINIITNNNTLFNDLPNNSVLSMKTGRFVFASPSFSSYITKYPDDNGLGLMDLRISFRVLMEDGTFKYIHAPSVRSSSIIKREPSFGIPAFEFPKTNFQIHLPDTATSVYSITFRITSTTDELNPSGTSYFMMWGGKAEFFVGDIASAPIYSPPQTESYDEYHALEEDLLHSNDSNKATVDEFLGNFSNIEPPSSSKFSILKALSFWQYVINDNVGSQGVFQEIIIYSLTIGLVMFVLSTGILRGITSNKDDFGYRSKRSGAGNNRNSSKSYYSRKKGG